MQSSAQPKLNLNYYYSASDSDPPVMSSSQPLGSGKKNKRMPKSSSSSLAAAGGGGAAVSSSSKNYYTAKGRAIAGAKGLYVTCVRGKEQRCIGEVYELLDQVSLLAEMALFLFLRVGLCSL